jgi:hypothetical protein
MSGPRVHDGTKWLQITEDAHAGGATPPPPEEEGDGKIFVVIPTFRGMFPLGGGVRWCARV